MRIAAYALFQVLLLSSCWGEDYLFEFPPEQALTGQWEISEGTFFWDNNTKVSSLNPVFESLPSVAMEFADGNKYLITFSFIVTNAEDTVTFANGLQEGNFQVATTENNVLTFDGIITFTENITNTRGDSNIRYNVGNDVDTLWIEALTLNNLLNGEIDGVFIRDNR